MVQRGTLQGPKINGNLTGSSDRYCLPSGAHGVINDARVCFTYVVYPNSVCVYTDLDSDYGIHKTWKGKPDKSLRKAQRALSKYGKRVDLAVLLQDGWQQ